MRWRWRKKKRGKNPTGVDASGVPVQNRDETLQELMRQFPEVEFSEIPPELVAKVRKIFKETDEEVASE